jgi:hypothetical protein
MLAMFRHLNKIGDMLQCRPAALFVSSSVVGSELLSLGIQSVAPLS